MQFSETELLAKYPFRDSQPLLIDVGAHHGYFAETFVQKGWRVIAFEPEQKNRTAFEQKFSKSERVLCIPKAVSNVTGHTVPFYVSKEHYGIHSLQPWHDTHKLAYEVETIRLDAALAEQKVSSVTLLKIDIEGADFLALQGFNWQKYRPELVMIEFMDERTQPNFDYNHHDVVQYMKKQGYTTFVSEWEAVKEYGREGVYSAPHAWIQCVLYPLDHEPDWGNLIFVPDEDIEKFRVTIRSYLQQLETAAKRRKQFPQLSWLRNQLKKVPGAKRVYQLIKGRQ